MKEAKKKVSHTRKCFTAEEDQIIEKFYKKETNMTMELLMQNIGHSKRSIEDRWKYFISCDKNFSEHDYHFIQKRVNEIGKKWGMIAREFDRKSSYLIRDAYNKIGKPKFKRQYPNFDLNIKESVSSPDTDIIIDEQSFFDVYEDDLMHF